MPLDVTDGVHDDVDVTAVKKVADALIENVSRVLVGKEAAIEDSLIALFCQGHLLAEDVPGVGKTMLAKALAQSLGVSFKRIQFTPDLLPSDVLGVSVFQRNEGDFEFRPGPVFAHVVLADEINRGTPRTQAALLECMEERQVTVDGVMRELERPFVVIATQNPIEFEGTFPLPEAQLDRFFARISLGYPDEASERLMLQRLQHTHPIDSIGQVVSGDDLRHVQKVVSRVHVEDHVGAYVVQLARASRSHPDVSLGVSPRGTLALFKASQARAALAGRGYVMPDDVKRVAPAIMTHRLLLTPEATMRAKEGRHIVDEIIAATPIDLGAEVPVGVADSTSE